MFTRTGNIRSLEAMEMFFSDYYQHSSGTNWSDFDSETIDRQLS